MRPLNVLILIDKFDYHGSHINGPTRYYSWLVAGIDRTRFCVHLCALRSRGMSDRIFREERIPVSYLNCGKYDPFVLLKIIRFIRRQRIDILHLTGYGSTTFGRIAGLVCRKPTIIHEHWVDPGMTVLQRTLERFLSPLTTRAIAISEYAREFLVSQKAVPADRVAVIPNGIPLDKFRTPDRALATRIRDGLGLADGGPVVGIIGMLHENKGHRYFIEAASLIAKDKPNIKFLVVGDGELRTDLEQQVTRLNLQGTVIFSGHQDCIPEILNILDVFVMASFSETAPLSLLEAMAAGKPIITTRCGGPSEIIQHGVSGLIIPPKDSKALAAQIQLLTDDLDLAKTLSTNAQKDCQPYRISQTIEAVQRLYDSLRGAPSGFARGAPLPDMDETSLELAESREHECGSQRPNKTVPTT